MSPQCRLDLAPILPRVAFDGVRTSPSIARSDDQGVFAGSSFFAGAAGCFEVDWKSPTVTVTFFQA